VTTAEEEEEAAGATGADATQAARAHEPMQAKARAAATQVPSLVPVRVPILAPMMMMMMLMMLGGLALCLADDLAEEQVAVVVAAAMVGAGAGAQCDPDPDRARARRPSVLRLGSRAAGASAVLSAGTLYPVPASNVCRA